MIKNLLISLVLLLSTLESLQASPTIPPVYEAYEWGSFDEDINGNCRTVTDSYLVENNNDNVTLELMTNKRCEYRSYLIRPINQLT